MRTGSNPASQICYQLRVFSAFSSDCTDSGQDFCSLHIISPSPSLCSSIGFSQLNAVCCLFERDWALCLVFCGALHNGTWISACLCQSNEVGCSLQTGSMLGTLAGLCCGSPLWLLVPFFGSKLSWYILRDWSSSWNSWCKEATINYLCIYRHGFITKTI